MGLICTPLTKLNLFYISYFIGYGLGGLFSFPIMDKISRRSANLIFGSSHVLAQAIIIFLPNYSARLLGYTLMGLMCAKNSVCFTWLFELVNKDHKSYASCAVSMLEFATGIIGGAYFLFVSRDWAPLVKVWFYIALACFVLLSTFCPESPKWLLLQGRVKEAIDSLNYIAKFNGSEERISYDTKFVESAVGENLENNETFNTTKSFT